MLFAHTEKELMVAQHLSLVLVRDRFSQRAQKTTL